MEDVAESSLAVGTADHCSLDNYLALPDHTMDDRIAAARAQLGTSTILLGHHYQRDEVIRFADVTGDSYKLSKIAAETRSRYVVFCGVHFMAESADILGPEDQQVILPDLNAGCSMADMAEIGQVEDCWDALLAAGLEGDILPLTYMNSAAAIKAFCGERGGLVCTSSNAQAAFEWAFARAGKILFLPDQHLGRNTAFAMGISLSEMVVWDPYQINGGISPDRLRAAKVVLWKGHCSVHQRFLPRPRGRGACQVSRYPGGRASRVPLGGLPEGRRPRLYRTHHSACHPGARRVPPSPSGPRFTWSIAWPGNSRRRARKSSPSTTQAASAPPCTASARNTWHGPLKTSSKAESSTASRYAKM